MPRQRRQDRHAARQAALAAMMAEDDDEEEEMEIKEETIEEAKIPEPARIDETRFVDVIPSYLMCSVCLVLAVDPVECIKCDKIQCSPCLRELSKCPNCRCDLAGNVKAINRNIKETVYDPLKVRCCNAPTCSDTPTLATLEKHQRDCLFNLIQCELCQQSLFIRDMGKHADSECPLRSITCKLCQVAMKANVYEQHRSFCKNEEISCPQIPTVGNIYVRGKLTKATIRCYDKMPRHMLSYHLANECIFREVECSFCQQTISFYSQIHHVEELCCKAYHCKLCNIDAKRTDNHPSVCPMVKEACKWAECGMELERRNLGNHEQVCKFRIIECRHCHHNLQYRQIRNHLKKECKPNSSQKELTLEDLKLYAVYYPNLSISNPIYVSNKLVNFTNDWGAYMYECRHFIDVQFLKSLDEGQMLFDSIVPPVPLCSKLVGKEMHEQKIVGMLSEALRVRYPMKSGIVMSLCLKQVLVVDRLPVPFHLSAKRLAHHVNHAFSFLLEDGVGACTSSVMKCIDFPPEYRRHAFWTENSIFLGVNEHERYGVQLGRYLRHASHADKDECNFLDTLMQFGFREDKY